MHNLFDLGAHPVSPFFAPSRDGQKFYAATYGLGGDAPFTEHPQLESVAERITSTAHISVGQKVPGNQASFRNRAQRCCGGQCSSTPISRMLGLLGNRRSQLGRDPTRTRKSQTCEPLLVFLPATGNISKTPHENV